MWNDGRVNGSRLTGRNLEEIGTSYECSNKELDCCTVIYVNTLRLNAYILLQSNEVGQKQSCDSMVPLVCQCDLMLTLWSRVWILPPPKLKRNRHHWWDWCQSSASTSWKWAGKMFLASTAHLLRSDIQISNRRQWELALNFSAAYCSALSGKCWGRRIVVMNLVNRQSQVRFLWRCVLYSYLHTRSSIER